MYNTLDFQFLLMKDLIFSNKQADTEKIKKHDSEIQKIKILIKQMMVHNQNYLTYKVD